MTVLTAGNTLTFARLLLLPAVIAGIATNSGYLAVVAMAIVVVTDLLDGRIARRLGQATAFGKLLDSTIDFVLIYSLFIALYAAGRLATYQFAIIYLAMLTTLALQLLTAGPGASGDLATTTLGKATGALQYGYLVFLVALEIVPRSAVIDVVGMVFFVALAVAIFLNSAECIIQIRRRPPCLG
jgi:CDP-diacylglycerol--glycerol-3-phosphate 3-phosphatidyltransferase